MREERCPTCGTTCETYAADEGTQGFVSRDEEVARLRNALEAIRDGAVGGASFAARAALSLTKTGGT